MEKPKPVGINHVALEVGDVKKALDFYAQIFDFSLRGQSEKHAFIELGDQFLALMKSSEERKDNLRHFGLVVNCRKKVKELAEKAGARILEGAFLDFLDPWGNRVQVVEYADVQFSKTPEVLAGMGLDLKKNPDTLKALQAKGMAP
ncbi:VOC family protein [Legionella israelensis]|uniref:VOC family protein n=1 Tax=Legionella israelensis TaxID=454 RepID=UPI0011810246|nr:VOC family protein [Legionella israelensis]QDP71951.1 VOC family protein [Legionella israelensis]